MSIGENAASRRKRNPIWYRATIDLLLSSAIIVLLAFTLTGLELHEWLGIAVIAVLVLHMLQSWRWTVATTARLFKPLPWKTRLNYLLTILLLIVIVAAIYSGLMISRYAVPRIGIDLPSTSSAASGPNGSRFWSQIHIECTNLVLVVVGLHMALNWPWIAATFNARVVRRFRNRNAVSG